MDLYNVAHSLHLQEIAKAPFEQEDIFRMVASVSNPDVAEVNKLGCEDWAMLDMATGEWDDVQQLPSNLEEAIMCCTSHDLVTGKYEYAVYAYAGNVLYTAPIYDERWEMARALENIFRRS